MTRSSPARPKQRFQGDQFFDASDRVRALARNKGCLDRIRSSRDEVSRDGTSRAPR